ncbi:tRNA lysidine(34) synthetase TilS [Desulfothermobacter acidiphilus]|uniref:tRNA lysidine(34) synthetase TilS n=1 Tax=Desulfothermobacter acidiphilus TaxID=1938353 RepID=UPI003F890CED
MDLLPVVELTVGEENMLSVGDRVVVGVSGGPDSLALLDLLHRLSDGFKLELVVAHLHHGLRPEAEAEAEMVREQALRYGCPFHMGRTDVQAHAQQHRLSVESAARDLRRRFLLEIASQTGATKIALGHQADDQAETVLLRLLRGTGPAGLKGILPVRGPFIRPLLRIRRWQIEAYCRWRGLHPCQDLSNWSPEFTRNRVRHQLLPWLAREFNPAVVELLVRLAELARAEDAFLETQALAAYRQLARPDREGVLLELSSLQELPLALLRRVLRLAYREVLGREDKELPFEHVEALRRRLPCPRGELSLPGGVRGIWERGQLVLLPATAAPPVPFYAYPVSVPGVTYLPEAGWVLQARLLSVAEVGDPRRLAPIEALLDWAHLHPPLVARRRLPGDRFHPFGYPAPVKLKDFFINQKVPRRLRDRLPLVEDKQGIVWVGGVRVGARAALGEGTTDVLHLRLTPLEDEAEDGDKNFP